MLFGGLLSKYEEYWLSIIDSIVGLIREAYAYGRSRGLDVSGLRRYGKRDNWYGRCSPSREIRESGLWNVEHVDNPRHIGPKQLS